MSFHIVVLSVFSLLLEHSEVGHVAFGGDGAVLHCLEDCAARLMGVGAGLVAAVVGDAEHFREIGGDLLRLDVHQAEAPDAGGVDDEAAAACGVDLVECGGVAALTVFVRYLRGLGVEGGVDGLDEGGLAHSGDAAEEGDAAAVALLPEGVHALAGEDRDVHYGVAGVGVDAVEESAFGLQLLGDVEVGLVEEYRDGNLVSLAGDQEAVDEWPFGLGAVEGDDEVGGVDVGGEDVTLAGEVGGLADDVVLPREDLGDGALVYGISVGIYRHGVFHAVAYRYRVGGRRAAQPQLASDHCVQRFPLRQLRQQVVAAGVLDHCRGSGMYSVLAHVLCFAPRRYKLFGCVAFMGWHAFQSVHNCLRHELYRLCLQPDKKSLVRYWGDCRIFARKENP